MQLSLTLNTPPLPKPISYKDKILLIGSCFTEHMSDRLAGHKFHTLANPHGILFNPLSVADSLEGYVADKKYTSEDLFHLNELWNSWDHHTRFSHIHQEEALKGINSSQTEASAAIRQAGWVMITLGSSFQYYLKEGEQPVANNHRAPSQWFEKRMLSTEAITERMSAAIDSIIAVNPNVQFLFTISPVRHIRDGVVANNRSKARLIEAVHTLCDRYEAAYYFPAYELVIDILRDYRFYDIDFVHPNYLATQTVWEEFVKTCIAPEEVAIMKEVKDIVTAYNHRPRFPQTEAHQGFLASYKEKAERLMQERPELDLSKEIKYFSES